MVDEVQQDRVRRLAAPPSRRGQLEDGEPRCYLLPMRPPRSASRTGGLTRAIAARDDSAAAGQSVIAYAGVRRRVREHGVRGRHVLHTDPCEVADRELIGRGPSLRPAGAHDPQLDRSGRLIRGVLELPEPHALVAGVDDQDVRTSEQLGIELLLAGPVRPDSRDVRARCHPARSSRGSREAVHVMTTSASLHRLDAPSRRGIAADVGSRMAAARAASRPQTRTVPTSGARIAAPPPVAGPGCRCRSPRPPPRAPAPASAPRRRPRRRYARR